jgi:hypothetical protein
MSAIDKNKIQTMTKEIPRQPGIPLPSATLEQVPSREILRTESDSYQLHSLRETVLDGHAEINPANNMCAQGTVKMVIRVIAGGIRVRVILELRLRYVKVDGDR